MVRQKLPGNKELKLLICAITVFIVLLGFQSLKSAQAGDKSLLGDMPKAKGAETMSNDWIKQLKSAEVDISKRVVRNKRRAVNQDLDGPIAYQQTDDSPEMNIDLDDLSSENVDLTEQDPDFKQVEGGVTDIKATVGKSQIIQFAQPIKRMSITDPSLVDLILLSPTQMIMNGKAAGVTSLIIWDESDQPAFFDLYVLNDTSDLLEAFRKVAPDEPINIKITDDGNVILSGTLSSTLVRDAIEKICGAYGYTLVDVAESPVPQVVLELKIAEISRSVTKNFSFRYKFGAWADQAIDAFMNSPRDPNGGQGVEWLGTNQGFTAAIFRPNARSQGIFVMGRQRGLLNVLAEPTLVTTNGREATFDAGQSIPVPTGVDQNGNLAYEYKNIGVKVTFTPWISEKSQRIELKLKPEVSEIDPSVTVSQPNGTVIFGFRNRTAETTVELENGESLMLAGLVRRNDNNTYIDPPFFGNIPLLGRLLSTSNFQKAESELIILVTPRIVKPGVYGEVLGTAE